MGCIVALVVFVSIMAVLMMISNAYKRHRHKSALPTNPVLPTQPACDKSPVQDKNPYAVDSDLGPEYYMEEQDDGTRVKHLRGSKEYYEIWKTIN